ncbi:pyrroline-5-carboxylate reductase [Pelagibacteraceae bacterium]|nr:pyrroline-5-carboxylate reductase [Pelagibacteraceae bacterium]
MKIGFIGTGKITSSIIYGIFKSKLKNIKISVSPRNRSIANKLSKKFRSVEIRKDNQEVIDRSDIIFLAVTPNVGLKILDKLRFTSSKKIISFISTINLANLKKLTKNKNITRAIPLPPIEIKKGPIVVCPPNKTAKSFFNHLGIVIEVRNEKVCNKFWSTSSLMAPFYEFLKTSTDWLVRKGVEKSKATNYVTELFLGLSQDAVNKKSSGLRKLVAESQTPRGLNEQALRELQKGKFYSKLNVALNNIHRKLNK